MSEQSNIELIKECYDAFTKGDLPRLLSHMSPDIEWELPELEGVAFSGTRSGQAQVIEFFQMVSAAQDIRDFRPIEFIAQGDRVVVRGHYDWTVKSTGVDFGSEWIHFFTVKDGLVTAFREFMDTHVVVEAYRVPHGAMPSPECPAIH
ncbi:nuclear transport factor 2 family protein [Pseudoduganella sp. GCM10020061]|uniref:nuclear transport factor 2 family protein n=1 Tax=Pseudoduganella sp. GCM10020061 TaxID=3317345 RepID=UPI003630C386